MKQFNKTMGKISWGAMAPIAPYKQSPVAIAAVRRMIIGRNCCTHPKRQKAKLKRTREF